MVRAVEVSHQDPLEAVGGAARIAIEQRLSVYENLPAENRPDVVEQDELNFAPRRGAELCRELP